MKGGASAHRPATLRTLLIPFALLLLVGFANAAEEASRNEPLPAAIPKFRRIFVPEEDPASWPTGGQRYLPIGEDEFAALLQAATARRKAAPGEFAPTIGAARYRATLGPAGTLSGVATLEIRHRGTQPALMRLAPWSLAIGSARWTDRVPAGVAEPASGAPAAIGNLPDGTLAVIVSRSGTLRLDWSLVGQQRPTGTLQFLFAVCSTASTHLELEAPTEVVPELDQAFIIEAPRDSEGRQWKIDLGGRTGGELRFVGSATRDHRQRLSLLHQQDAYHVSRRGVDCSTLLEIVAHGDSLSSVDLELDPGLEVTTVRLGEQNLLWTVGPGKRSERRLVRVELPKPIAGKCPPLKIATIAALPLGKLLPLPRLRATNLFWQEGSIAVSMEPPLVLNQVETTGARPQLTSNNERADAPETFRWQCLTADDEVRIEADFPQTRWSVREGAQVEFRSGEIVSRSVVDFAMDGPDVFQVTCHVNPDWQIDSVEAELPLKVGEWEVVETGMQRVLLVRIRPEAMPNNRVRLKVAGRRSLPAQESAGVHALSMLSFPRAASQSRSLLLLTPESLQLQLHGLEAAQTVDLRELSVDDPLYSDPMPPGIALALNADAEHLVVSLSPKRPQFNAELRIVARVSDDAVEQTCEITCLPSGAALDRLLIHTSKSEDPAPWQWSGDRAMGKVTVRKLSTDERLASGTDTHGDAWELSWRLPQRDRVTLHGVRQAKFTAALPIALVVVPEAASQTGQLQIAVEDGTEVEIENRRLRAIPSTVAARGKVQRVRGTYAFDPTRHGLLGEPAILVARSNRPGLGNQPWVSELTLDTRLLSGETAQQVAIFAVQTGGHSFARFTMPANATAIAVDVNGVALDTSSAELAEHTFRIHFPRDAGQVSVAIYFQTRQPLPRVVGHLRPAFPQTSLRVVSRRWRLWLPVGYDAPTDSLLANRYCRREVSWSERLFGPLGRDGMANTRNPLRGDFWAQFGMRAAELQVAREAAVSAIQAMGTVRAAGTSATWADAVAHVADGKSRAMLVARSSLLDAGITADSRLPASDAEEPLACGIDRLQKTNLSLLVCGNRILLAAMPLIALNRHDLLPLEGLPAFCVTDGPLATDLKRSPDTPDDFVTPAAWQLAASIRPVLGKRPFDFMAVPHDATMLEMSGTDSDPMSATVLHRPTMLVIATATAVFVLGLGVLRRLARSRYWSLVVALAFAFACLAPPAWNGIAAAMFAGAATAWLLLAIRTRKQLGSDQEDATAPLGSSTPSVGVMASSFLAVTLSVTASAPAQMADPPERQPPPATTPDNEHATAEIVRILVPIDEAQHSVGSKIYLPEAFYTDLLSVAEKVRETPRGWMFTEARYRAVVAGDLFQPEMRKLEIQTRFKVYAFESDMVLTLPLGDASTRLVEGTVLLDGRVAAPVQAAAGQWKLPIAEPGKHAIDLLIEVPLRVLGTQAGIDLVIPRVAGSELELAGADALRVEVLGAVDKPPPADSAAQRHLGIGNLQRLAIRWPDISVAEEATSSFQVEELYWARIKPGSLSMDARLTLHAMGKEVHGLQLQTDASLALLDTHQDVRVVATRMVSGNRRLVDLELQTPIADARTIDLRFVVPGISGTGNLRLPMCEVVGAHATRRWMGVSVDPALSYVRDAGESTDVINPADFGRAWDPAMAVPQFAYQLSEATQTRSIVTQPKISLATSESTLSLHVEPTGTDVNWTASVSAAEAEFQWQLNVPSTLLVSDLTILQSNRGEIPLRWSRDGESAMVHATTTTPVRGEYRISLRGRMKHEARAHVQVPAIEIARVQPVKQTLLVYQHHHVQVAVSTDSNWEPSEVPPAAPSGTEDRLIGEWSAFRSGALAELQVTPNTIEGSATQVVAVNLVDDHWSIDIYCHLAVRKGAVDCLALDVPADWSSLKLLSEPTTANLSIAARPARHLQRLTLRPREPIRKGCQLRISARLPSKPGLTIRLPAPVFDGMDVQSFLLLPRQGQQERVQWDLTQLAAAELPSALVRRIAPTGDFRSYHVVGDQPAAVLREAGPGSDIFQPLHIEHRIRWTTDGAYGSKSTFVLDRCSKSKLNVLFPPATTVLQCSVGGIPVPIEMIGPRRGRLMLPMPGGAQWVDLLLAGQLAHRPRAGTPIEWTAPQLEGVHAAAAWWLLQNPCQVAFAAEVKGDRRQELLISRLSAADAILQSTDNAFVARPSSTLEGRIIDESLKELEIGFADRRMPASTLQALGKSYPWLKALRQARASEKRPAWGAPKPSFSPVETRVAMTTRGEGSIILDPVRSTGAGLAARLSVALAAICLAAIGMLGLFGSPQLRLSPLAAGIIAAAVLWFAVEPVILPAFVLLLTLLWMMAPSGKTA